MKEDSLQFLCCPFCHGELFLDAGRTVGGEIISGVLKCHACKREYEIDDGIPDFLLPEFLADEDERCMHEYDKMARDYDLTMSFLVPIFSLGLELLEKRSWVRSLQIKRGDRVLDVSTGTGRNISLIVREIGPNGRLVGMDISKGVLDYARMKAKRGRWMNVELHRANASYLPYKDSTFDAVMHVGGINTFGEKRRALHDMVRVAKPNAKIVIVDEGIAKGKEDTFVGGFLLRMNRLYWSKPPTKLLPKRIQNLRVNWGMLKLLGVVPVWPFYIMEFRRSP